MSDKKYQVFVSSTFTDLEDERNKVLKSLLDLNCIPAGMEYFPATDEQQFEYIKRIIDESDYYVLILAGRYGSIHPKLGISFTELEYDYAVSTNKPIIALIHNNPGEIASHKTDPENKDKLKAFSEKVVKNGKMSRFWSNGYELAGILVTSLQYNFKTGNAKGWIREGEVPYVNLLEEIHHLQSELSQLRTRSDIQFFDFQRSESDKKSLRDKAFANFLKTQHRLASRDEIQTWIEGSVESGNSPSNFYLRSVLYVSQNILIPALYGASSLHLLIAPGCTVTYLDNDIGHSTIMFMDGFKYLGL